MERSRAHALSASLLDMMTCFRCGLYLDMPFKRLVADRGAFGLIPGVFLHSDLRNARVARAIDLAMRPDGWCTGTEADSPGVTPFKL
jgi:hypothetical protein